MKNKNEYSHIISLYERHLSRQSPTDDLKVFLSLLFDPGDTVQVKEHIRETPANAIYTEPEHVAASLSVRHSQSGVLFCMNAIPKVFMDQIAAIVQHESVGQSQWDAVADEMKKNLTLSAELFEVGRTFFIEADRLPNGNYIETSSDKLLVLAEILASELPITYIVDTGGRGPHLGIVLEDVVKKVEFDHFVESVMQRLPTWIDGGVGRINQIERMPGTTRINKQGKLANVSVVYLGRRIRNSDLQAWIETHPITNPGLKRKLQSKPERHSLNSVDLDEAEGQILTFIEQNNLKHARPGKMKVSVSCPKAADHAGGSDDTMSAVIFFENGNVWCAACNKTVAWVFPKRQSPLLKSTSKVDLSSIKPTKLF